MRESRSIVEKAVDDTPRKKEVGQTLRCLFGLDYLSSYLIGGEDGGVEAS